MRRSALARPLAIASTLCAVVTALLVAFAPTMASAQRVLTREAGSVGMSYAPWDGAIEPRIVRPGDETWVETLIIHDAVRLERDVPARVRPSALAAQAGTVLYGYQLLRGAAYCVPFDLSNDHVRAVQCFRDFNDDGIFDGAYVAESYNRDARAFPRHVYALIGQRGAINYTRLNVNEAPSFPARVVFVRMSGDTPRLRLETDRDIGTLEQDCEIIEPEVCNWAGAVFRFKPQANGVVEIQRLHANPDRAFSITMRDAR
ncbi:hypothetical protein [Vitreimonas flagellata]|uniref:hypothetical protein n=1 Tax=Vitreimonas flagellata TaxID=2560861 RepID=UPI001074FB5C|nr:hypothetical protein [Vitreimonas flagellata]